MDDEMTKMFEALRQDNLRSENQKKGGPSYEEYIPFFEEHLPGAKRCIFSDECKIFENEVWQPAASKLSILASHALDSCYFKKAHLQEHFSRFVASMKPELLVEIPEWDGVDRIELISKALTLKNCTQDDFYELIKEWGALMFERLENPRVQNRIIVLKGGQGIGKDTLVHAILGDLGPYMTNLSISRNEADNLAMLADHLVLNISEFDRTSRTDASLIKDWITREEATFRRPYERSHRRYSIRCSFIATVNVDEILRDHTGNRRFVVFDIEKIDWNYPKNQSLQILAQFRKLSKEKYRASTLSQQTMKTYIEANTPDDPKEALLEVWDERIANLEENGLPERKGRFRASDVGPVVLDLAKMFGYYPKTIYSILKSNGRSRRSGGKSIYFRCEEQTAETEVSHVSTQKNNANVAQFAFQSG
jgi:hypothetical protein